MTLDEARRILGLTAGEDPAPHLKDFSEARDRIAELVRTAPNAGIAERYQSGLSEFDAALDAVRLHLAESGQSAVPVAAVAETPPPPSPPPIGQPAVASVASTPVAPVTADPVLLSATPEPVISPVVEIPPATPAENSPTPSLFTPPSKHPYYPTQDGPVDFGPPPAFVPQDSTPAMVDPAASLFHPPAPPAPSPIPAPPPPDPAAVQETPPELPPVEPVAPAPPESRTQGHQEDQEFPPRSPAEPAPAIPVGTIVSEGAAPARTVEPGSADKATRPSHPTRRGLLALLLLLLLAIGGGWVWLRMEGEQRIVDKGQIAGLEKEGYALLESLRLQEAKEVQERMIALDPSSEAAATLGARISEKIDEEQKQMVQYWNNEALAAFESNRFDDATATIQQWLAKIPNDPNALELRGRIAEARKADAFRHAKEGIRSRLEAKEWEEAISVAENLTAKGGLDAAGSAEINALLQDARAGKAAAEAAMVKARALFAKAKERDTGKYDAEGLEWAREAAVLAPHDQEIKSLFEKLASYTRTLHVPGDFTTVAEALASARDRDRVVLAEGEWKGPLTVNTAIELQGSGSGKSFVTCAGADGAAITFGPGAQGARVTGISFRHLTLDPAAERFSAALVRGGKVSFGDCHFLDAAGHGLAVIGGGQATAVRCRFSGNAWDGASASGGGTILEVKDSEALHNFEHGIDLWEGATGTISGNRCEGNSRNGIQIDAGNAAITVTGNQLRANREFGMVLARGALGKITGNTLEGNLLGGLAIRLAAARLEVGGNRIQSPNSPAIALEKGLPRSPYAGNTVQSGSPQIMENLDFAAEVKPE